MLQRAAETVSGDDECNDPAVLLACALGSTGCPAKCAEAEKNNTDKNPNNAFNGVVAGDLSVAVSTSSSVTSIPNSGVIKVAELDVKASEDIQLQSVDVTREGLSTNKDIKVWIEKDGKRITSSSSFFGDSKANLTFNNGGYVVKSNETLDLVVSLSGVTAGSELQFKVSNMVSSAKNTTVSPDTTGLFRTANYQATSISFVSLKNNDRSYNLSDTSSLSFGEFKLQNDSPASMEKDVLVKSITFKVDGSIENLTNFKLLRDSKEVSSKYAVDGKSVTFAVNDQLDSGKSGTYKVTAEVTNIEATNGDDYTFSIRKAEDVIAEEIGTNATAYRVSVNGDLPTLGKTTIKGGNIILTKDSKLASTVSADWGYSDVVVAKGTIKVNQAVKFDSAYITGDGMEPEAVGLDKVLRRATLVVDWKTYQAEREAAGLKIDSEIYLSKGEHTIELQVSLNNSTVYGTEKTAVAGTIPAGAKITALTTTEGGNPATIAWENFRVWDIISTAWTLVLNNSTVKYVLPTTKLKFKALDKDTFRGGNYTNGDETKFTSSSIAGNIRVSEVKVEEKVISVKKSWPSEDVKIRGGNTDEKVVLVGEISNTTDKVLEINKFNITPVKKAGTLASELWDVYVVLWDNTSSTVAVKGSDDTNGVNIDSVTTTLEPGKSTKFEVRIIPDADLTAANADFRFAVKLSGKLGGNDTSSSTLNSAYVIINNGATTSIVANTADSKLIVKPGVSTKVASFNYNVKSDSVDVESMTFTVAGFGANDLDDLTIDFGGSIGAPGLTYKFAGDASAGTVTATFNNIVTLPDANYKVNVYATFNESAIDIAKKVIVNTTAGNEWKPFTVDGDWNPVAAATLNNAQLAKQITNVAIKEGGNVTPKTAGLSFKHYVAKAYPILSVKDKNTNQGNTRLDLNVRKSNDDGHTVQLVNLNSAVGPWNVIEWSETVLWLISLSADSATVIRSVQPQESVTSIDFVVTDDEGNSVYYKWVNAGSDFASLSL